MNAVKKNFPANSLHLCLKAIPGTEDNLLTNWYESCSSQTYKMVRRGSGEEPRKNNLNSQAKMSIFLRINWGHSEGESHSMFVCLDKYRFIFIYRMYNFRKRENSKF